MRRQNIKKMMKMLDDEKANYEILVLALSLSDLVFTTFQHDKPTATEYISLKEICS